MDEPLSNLDAKLRVQMRSEIKRFHLNLDATIVYVTHDQLEAVTMADKMAVMHGGFLQQYDSPAAVFAHPVNAFVASFVGSPAMSLIPADVATADGRHRPPRRRRLGAPPLRPQRPQGAVLLERQGHPRRPPLDPEAAQGRHPRRRPRPRPHRRAHRRHHLRPDPDRRRGGEHQPPPLRRPRARRERLGRVRPGPPPPLRRRHQHGALGMRITAVTPLPAWVGIRNQLLVKVETDAGHLRLGRERPLRPREGGRRRHRALRPSS